MKNFVTLILAFVLFGCYGSSGSRSDRWDVSDPMPMGMGIAPTILSDGDGYLIGWSAIDLEAETGATLLTRLTSSYEAVQEMNVSDVPSTGTTLARQGDGLIFTYISLAESSTTKVNYIDLASSSAREIGDIAATVGGPACMGEVCYLAYTEYDEEPDGTLNFSQSRLVQVGNDGTAAQNLLYQEDFVWGPFLASTESGTLKMCWSQLQDLDYIHTYCANVSFESTYAYPSNIVDINEESHRMFVRQLIQREETYLVMWRDQGWTLFRGSELFLDLPDAKFLKVFFLGDDIFCVRYFENKIYLDRVYPDAKSVALAEASYDDMNSLDIIGNADKIVVVWQDGAVFSHESPTIYIQEIKL